MNQATRTTNPRPPGILNNAHMLDTFYIAAFGGTDWETGEIVDRRLEAATARDDVAYGYFPPTLTKHYMEATVKPTHLPAITTCDRCNRDYEHTRAGRIEHTNLFHQPTASFTGHPKSYHRNEGRCPIDRPHDHYILEDGSLGNVL